MPNRKSPRVKMTVALNPDNALETDIIAGRVVTKAPSEFAFESKDKRWNSIMELVNKGVLVVISGWKNEEVPAEETPTEETPAEKTPAEEAPAEEAPAEEEAKPKRSKKQ